MPVTLVRNAPVDASAGYMSVRYLQSGKISTIERFHLNTVDAATVNTEFTNLVGFLHPFFNADWTIQLTALTQRSGSVLRRIPVPTASGGGYLQHVGTGGTATAGAEGYIQTILTLDTATNNKARVRLVGVGGQGIDIDGAVDANATGTALEKLVNYLVNTTTHIVAHDGSKMALPAHVTYALVSRERRRSMRVA